MVVYPSILDKSRNRGFAFVEYRDHKSAAYARKKFLQEPLIVCLFYNIVGNVVRLKSFSSKNNRVLNTAGEIGWPTHYY